MNKKENMSIKNSNIKWIGIIPQGWEIKRFKNYFTNIGGGNYGYDIQENSKIKLPCFSISDFKNGNLDNENKNLIKTNRAYDKENILKKGVILVEKSGGGEKTPVGRMVIVKEDVKAYYTNFVQGIKINNKMNENFILYILKTTYNLRLHMKYVKQNTGLQNFKFNNFANDLLIPVPKLEVQNKIVNFIDYNLITLSKKIKKYNKKIELLKEYKESLIYETVTKGLDKNVEMKDSGIDWIGRIPKSFSIKRLKDVYIYKNGYSFSDEDYSEENNGNYLIKITQIKEDGININKEMVIKDNDRNKLFKIKKMSILYALSGATAGKSCFFDSEYKCYLNQRVAEIRLKKGNSKYLYYIFKNKQMQHIILNSKQSTAQPNINKSDIDNFIIPYISNINKQNEIVDFLDKKTKEIDSEVEILSKKIGLIEELKESIIYECVTGKIDIEVDGEKYQKIIESI